MNRVERLLSYVKTNTECGLEIGPRDKPIVKRRPGRSVFYCDYADRETQMRNSASDPTVDPDRIPEIDFVTSQIDERTFGSQRFDYILASHVIEHIPDIVSWLRVLLQSLNPNGRIVLAVNDKRYCFDYLRPLTTVGEVINAFLDKRSKPTAQQIYDGFSQAVSINIDMAWGDGVVDYYYLYSKPYAWRMTKEKFDNGQYQDCRCWVFTHSSFAAVMSELKLLGILDVEILAHPEPVRGSNEFHIVLGRSSTVAPSVKYDGKVIVRMPPGAGKDGGWYFVEDGLRRWVATPKWHNRTQYNVANVASVSSADFNAIDEGPPITD